MTPQAGDDVAELATRVLTYHDWITQFLELAERLNTSGRNLDGALCLRAAEFFMLPDDPRRPAARRGFVDQIRTQYGVGAHARVAVPYRGISLPAYVFGEPHRGHLVVHGGFGQLHRGVHPAAAHPGPGRLPGGGLRRTRAGQGLVLQDHNVAMTAAWHQPVGAVLDHFAIDEATLIGISLGGGLAIHAAAFDDRITRVVAYDVLPDFLASSLHHLPPLRRLVLHTLLTVRARPLVNLVAQVTQLYTQLAALTNTRSSTARLFTQAEQAASHCQVGNLGLAVQVILDWLDGLDRRDNVAARPTPTENHRPLD
jgi:pimeloyl-ACP methyl ester carboxylesterase